jgi:hypothetical protein
VADDDTDGDSREQKIAAILRDARETRRRPSRTMWIAAGVVGIACAIAFAMLMLGDDRSAPPKPRRDDGHASAGERLPPSFVAGLATGLVAGIVIGFAIGRQRHSSRNSP